MDLGTAANWAQILSLLALTPLGWNAATDLWNRRELACLLDAMAKVAAPANSTHRDRRVRCARGSRREAAALLGVKLGALRPKGDRGTLTVTLATLNDPEQQVDSEHTASAAPRQALQRSTGGSVERGGRSVDHPDHPPPLPPAAAPNVRREPNLKLITIAACAAALVLGVVVCGRPSDTSPARETPEGKAAAIQAAAAAQATAEAQRADEQAQAKRKAEERLSVARSHADKFMEVVREIGAKGIVYQALVDADSPWVLQVAVPETWWNALPQTEQRGWARNLRRSWARIHGEAAGGAERCRVRIFGGYPGGVRQVAETGIMDPETVSLVE